MANPPTITPMASSNPSTLLYQIKGRWEGSSYELKVDLSKIRHIQGEIFLEHKDKPILAQVKWHIPIFSRIHLKTLFSQAPKDLTIEIKKNETNWTVHIFCPSYVKNFVEMTAQKINDETILNDPLLLNGQTDLLRRNNQDEVKERCKILKKVIKATCDHADWKYAGGVAMTILRMAGYCFSGRDFDGIQVVNPNLTGIVLDRTRLNGANFQRANLTNAYLREPELNGTIFHEVEFGQLPRFKQELPVTAMILSPDEKFLLSSDPTHFYLRNNENGEVKKIETIGRIFRKKDEQTAYHNIVFLKEGDFFLRGNNKGEISIWEFPSCKRIKKVKAHGDPVQYLELTGDGSYLVSGVMNQPTSRQYAVKNEFKCWAVQRDKKGVNLKQVGEASPFSFPLHEVRLSRTGSFLAVLPFGGIAHTGIYLYPLPDLKRIQKTIFTELKYSSMQFTPEGSLLAVARTEKFSEDKTIVELWNVNEELQENEPRKEKEQGHFNNVPHEADLFIENGVVSNMLFLDRDLLMYTKIVEGMSSHLCIRNIKNNSLLCSFQATQTLIHRFGGSYQGVWGFATSQKYGQIFAIDKNNIHIWKLSQLLQRGRIPFNKSILEVHFSYNGQYLFVLEGNVFHGDYLLHQYDVFNGDSSLSEKVIKKEEGVDFINLAEFADCLLTSEGKMGRFEDETGCGSKPYPQNLRLRNLESGLEQAFFNFPFDAYCISQDQLHIAFLRNQTIEIWALSPKKIVGSISLQNFPSELHRQFVISNLLPNGYLAAGNQDEVFLWKIKQKDQEFSSELIKTIKWKGKRISQVIVSEQNQCLVASDEHKIIIWDLQNQREQRISQNHRFYAVSPCEPLLLSLDEIVHDAGTISTNIKLWDLQTGACVEEILGLPSIVRIHFSLDGRTVAGYSWPAPSVYLWDLRGKKLFLRWRVPQYLEVHGVNLKNTELSLQNKSLLEQAAEDSLKKDVEAF